MKKPSLSRILKNSQKCSIQMCLGSVDRHHGLREIMETVKIIKKNSNDKERKAWTPQCPLGAAQYRDWCS